ncbi:unnamed protein product [Spirodela intermedia]|uniref:F-box domain-containing protein n=1 Tax=Spirodela intermedia TaxID=51605 RepID=A0A7I8K0U4_SPIIN|nr:unnamed protein product [Spirodela intermedia]
MAVVAEEQGRGIGDLPEECVSLILSFTSPRDACRSAAVSSAFLAAASSGVVWGRFLPPDYEEILSMLPAPLAFRSKKELYSRLCDSVLLISGGRKIFALERATGRKCVTLSARDLNIVWGDSPHYWRWTSVPDSRFSEAAELLNVCWLEIRGKIACRMLSPKTTYVAHLVFKLSVESHGLDYPSQEGSIRAGSRVSSEEVCLHPCTQQRRSSRSNSVVRFRRMLSVRATPPPAAPSAAEKRQVPRARGDGWMEVLIGEFLNDDVDEEEVEVSFTEIRGGHWKSGLVVKGIEIRPK